MKRFGGSLVAALVATTLVVGTGRVAATGASCPGMEADAGREATMAAFISNQMAVATGKVVIVARRSMAAGSDQDKLRRAMTTVDLSAGLMARALEWLSRTSTPFPSGELAEAAGRRASSYHELYAFADGARATPIDLPAQRDLLQLLVNDEFWTANHLDRYLVDIIDQLATAGCSTGDVDLARVEIAESLSRILELNDQLATIWPIGT